MDKKMTGIVAYISLIGLILAFCIGDKEGAKFHINQALVVTLFLFAAGVVSWIPYIGGIASGILGLFVFVMWVMGLISAINEEEKELPIIGAIHILK